MANVTKKELADALQLIVEDMNGISETLAKLGAGLFALKAVVSIQLNPSNPEQGLKQIQKFEENFERLDPNAEARKKVSEVLEMLKTFDKHGGPKEA